MSTHKHFDKICCIAIALCLVLTVIMMNAEAFGITVKATVMGYENKLFADGRVHTIDILMDDWDGFIATCEDEEYVVCSVVVDGEPFKNVAIRAKGNTSLSSVAAYGNDRYSFKIEFDHYDNSSTYYGLDKLSLNNIIQDNTYMKDYLVYTMMGEFGAASPLCSYVYITVNGEDFGLYLAVEALEESFLVRNYGNNYGDLYKPDSMNMGGGRGNGKDFDMDAFMGDANTDGDTETENSTNSGSSMFPSGGGRPNMGGMEGMPDMGNMPNMGDFSGMPDMGDMGEMPDMGDFDFSQIGGGMMGGFGMGSSETKLQYIDDDPDSYSTIFDSAKTKVSGADKERLIASLKSLSSYENLDEVLDMDAVLRYFVVHNFVCNGDSYTGSIIHNYYLYEENGALTMLPWDYNLAFGGMNGGDATSAVNDPINSPVSGGTGEDRPMIGWIFSDEEYTALYESYFDSFVTEFFESGYVTNLINSTIEMITPYVEKDPTKFCTYEEFEVGSATLLEFCELRAESIRAQLDGTIGKTSATQDEATFVSADHINISDMGSMGGGMGGGFGGRGDMPDRGDKGDFNKDDFSGTRPNKQQDDTTEGGAVASPASLQNLSGMPSMPDGFGGQLPEGFDGQLPEGFEGISGQLPEGFEGMIPGASSTSSPNGGAEETTGSGQSGMTRPDNMGNFGGSFSGTSSGSTGSGGGTATLLLVSILALGTGLAVAFVFKGREI